MPTLAEINAVSPDVPVFVLHLYDRALLNAAALRACDAPRASSAALFTRQFINPIWIETDDDFISDDQRGGGPAAVAHQISDRACVHSDIANFVINTSLREVRLHSLARWSPGLGEQHHSFHQDHSR